MGDNLKPYYETENGVLYNGDCLEVMKQLELESIDLCLTDPPYGDGAGYGRQGKTIANNEDESINFELIDMVEGLLKDNTNLYIFSNHKFWDKIKNHKCGLSYLQTCIMVKNNIGMGGGFRNQYEVCLVFEKGKPSYELKNMSNVWFMEHIQHSDDSHPHQKGLKMIEKIIKHSSQKKDIILDPFLGSGTTALACERLGRKWIGIELSKDYCEIAKKRIEAEISQLKLF